MKKIALSVLLSLTSIGLIWGQEDKRNVMLNAESGSAPRVINIGLPDSSNGAVVFVDGLKHAFGLPRSQYHWAGGNAYENVGTIDFMEAVVQYAEFSVPVNSSTRVGSDVLSGAFTGTSSSNGLIRFDGSLRGPLAGKWQFALGAYVNFDPTSVNAPSRPFVDQKQIYQASLSRIWDDASLSMTYRLSFCNDRVDGGYSVAPFVYNGNGTIGLYDGFRLGRDCYMPADEAVRWMDLVSGQWKEGDMSKMDRRRLHDFHLTFRKKNLGGWDFLSAFHLCYMAPSNWMKVQLAGVDQAISSMGYSLPDGSVFTGLVQNRQALFYDTWTFDPEIRVEGRRTLGRHTLKVGTSLVYARQYESSSTFRFAHTVEAAPKRVFKGGQNTWNFNRNSTWFDSWKIHADLYLFDSWRISKSFLARTGVRVRGIYNDVYSVARLDGETINTRVEGFNLANPALAQKHRFQAPGIDYVVSESLSWRICRGLSAVAEGFYSMTPKAATYYRNATLPSLKSIGNAMVRGGLTMEGEWYDLTALVSYVTSWNNAAQVNVTKQIGGISETLPWVAQYGIGTLGFTFDGSIHFGGFSLHARATWQDPRYKNYRNEFVFSDGSVSVIDYTGKTVTGISKLMIEFDPSFSWKFFKVWASARYYSRQYVSRTNLAYFNGHFETFAGAQFMIGKHNRINLNVVNILMDQGAKGSIDIADTIEDASALQGLVMAGSYIRPFTVDLSYTFSF